MCPLKRVKSTAVELQPTTNLVGEVEFIAVAAARGAGRIRTDVRINDGLGLLPQVIHREGKGDIALNLGAHSHLLAVLLCEQWGVRKSQIHAPVLIDAAQIGAVKSLAGGEVELEVVVRRIDQAALGLEQRLGGRAPIGISRRLV